MQQIMKRFAKMEGRGDPEPVMPVATTTAAVTSSPVKKPRTVRTGGRGRPRNIVSPKPTPPPPVDGEEHRKPGRGRPRGSTLANKAAAAQAAAAAIVDERHKRAKFTSDDGIKNDAVRELLGDDSDVSDDNGDDDHADGDDDDADSVRSEDENDGKPTATAVAAVAAAVDEPDFASPLSMKKAWIKKAASSTSAAPTVAPIEPKKEPTSSAEPISMKRKLLESYRAGAADEPTQPTRPRLSRPEMVEMLLALLR